MNARGIRRAMRGFRFVPWFSLFTGAVIFPVGAKFFPYGEESKQFSGNHDGNMIPATSRKNDLASFRWIMWHPFPLIYRQGQRKVQSSRADEKIETVEKK